MLHRNISSYFLMKGISVKMFGKSVITLLIVTMFTLLLNDSTRIEDQVILTRSFNGMSGNDGNEDTAPISYDDEDARWRRMEVSDWQFFFLYSAFYDESFRSKPVIRILAVAKRDTPFRHFVCGYVYSNETATTTLKGDLVDYGPQPRTPYNSKYIICPVQGTRIPEFITVRVKPYELVKLKVFYAKKPEKNSSKSLSLNMCVRTLFNYSDATQLIEFIEYHRIHKVEHFTIFHESTSVKVSKILKYYQNQGIVSLLMNNLPSGLNVYAKAQFSQWQHCFLRSRGQFSHVAYADLDERIVPRKNKNIYYMVKALNTPTTSAFSIPRAEFCLHYPINGTIKDYLTWKTILEQSGSPLNLVSLLHTTKYPKSCRDRGKMIVNPWRMKTLGLHNVIESVKGFSVNKLGESTATVHHYKACPTDFDSFTDWMTPCALYEGTRVDTIMHKYMTDLIREVTDTMHKINLT